MTITFELNFLPPSLNNCFPTSRSGHRYVSDRYKLYRDLFHANTLRIKPKQAMLGDLRLEVDYYFADRRKRDLDNYLKPTIDCLVECGFMQDDSQITQIIANKCKGKDCTVIRISEVM